MANQYEIIVKASDYGKAEGYEATFPDGAGGGDKKSGTQLTTDNMQMFAKATAAVGLATSAFKWQASLIGRNTGNSDLQQKIDASMTVAQQGIGIITAFAVGGVLGGVLAVAAVGLSYAKQAESFYYERQGEDIELGVARYRAGPSLNRSRS